MKGYPSIIHRGEERQDDNGFTLVEILIAIVLVGILSAVVVVGISNMTSKGSSSACAASLDAAKAGSIVYFASHNNTYATNFTLLTTETPAVGAIPAIPAALTLPSGVTVNAVDAAAPHAATAFMQATSGSWWLDMTLVSGGAPTFACTA